MSRGRDIKGLTVEIGGDTTGLQKSLKGVNTEIKTTQAELKDINNLLKLDPTNTELLQQKQKALANEIESTKEKLETLKAAEQQAQQQFAEGKISQEQYDALKREIIATEESLKSLETEAKNAPNQMQQSLEGLNTKIKTTQTELKEIDKLLKLDPTNTELLQQKQRALSDEIGNTKEKLQLLKNEEQEVQQKFQEGKVSQEQYDALKRSIIETEESLKSLEDTVGSGSAKLAGISAEAGKIGENLTSAGEKMLPVTAAVTGLGTAAVKTAADFDAQMAKVSSISGATGKDLTDLEAKAREMGAQTKFSAKEAGEAMEYMAMAGWETGDMLDGIEGIMNLAAASGEDLATTSDIVTDALTAFGMKAGESSHFADVLAKASSSANTNVSMMGETFKYVAPVAGALKYNAEDTAVAIGLMANSGIKASQAGTQLRASLTNMIKPSKAVGDAMELLGFYATEASTSIDQAKVDKQMIRVQKATLAADKAQQAYNDAVSKYGSESTEASNAAATLEIKQAEIASANETLTQLQEGTTDTVRLYNKALQNEDGSMKSLRETMDFLRETMGDMSEAQQTQAATAIFGKEAMSGMLAIINASDEDYQKLIKNIDNADGAAEKMAETMQDTLSGQITELQSALQELAIAFGEILMPYIRKIVSVVQNFVKKLNGMSDTQKKIVATIALIVAAIGPLLITIGKISTGISAVTGALSKAKNIGKIVGVLGNLKSALSGIFAVIKAGGMFSVVGIIAAIVAAVVVLYNKCEWFRDAVDPIIQTIASFFTETIPQAWNYLMNCFSGIPAWWSGIWQQVSDFFTGIWMSMMQNPVVSELVTMITKLWKNGVDTWQGVWKGLVTIAQGVWEMLKNTILAPVLLLMDLVTGDFEKMNIDMQKIWTNMKNAANKIWSGIKTVVTALARGLKTGVEILFSGLKNTANRIWESLKRNILNIAANLRKKAVEAFGKMVNGIENTLSGLGTVVENGFQSAISFITSLPGKAWNWGVDFINGIANGIRNAMSNVTRAVSDVANNIRSFLHFSVPDEGPLTDYESWMPDFIEGLAKGIESSRAILQKAVQDISEDLVVSANIPDLSTEGTTVNFYGNYKFENKQDIDYFMNQAALKISRKRR
ncbi:MAG: phage tail tape measure protein [Eubacteriales bacterium]|nr:phage tail tape measure protein [Eubacteriales bacterium]